MANITITPTGAAFNSTDTVTSTRLNEARNPTAALVAASIGTADIADDAITPALIADNAVTTPAILDANVTTAKIADANVTFAKLTDVIDDDTMATATDTTLATSESIKAYADAAPKAQMKVNNVSGATYNGEESVTLPNGLIMKMGVTSGLQTQSPLVVTFAEEFPNGIIIAQATATNTSAGNGSIYDYWYQVVNQSRKESVSLIAQGSSTNPTAHNVNWMVIGY